MIYRRLLSLILLSVAVGLPASAKLTRFILRGYVEKQDYSKTDWQRESVDSVFVSLVQNDTIPVDFKLLSGNDDLKLNTQYELRMLVQGGTGAYTLILNKEGYEPLRRNFNVTSESQDVVYVRSMLMEPSRSAALDEVEVIGTAIKMVMKGDTIVYDSRAFALAEGSTLDALVRQLPGAELAADGSITVNGRKVRSLLLDGNDFFKGDPDVALKNLPAYTVDKIKVYDKAAKDDKVTLASQTLTDNPDNENLVMDVRLKKEFAMATILAVEGGYGPGIYPKENSKRYDHRYIGRAFLVGFGKTYRFSAFGNVNNIRNTSKATSSNKDWRGGWASDGELEVKMGGMDVFWHPNDKNEVAADMMYTDENITNRNISASTLFYDTGNLYRRSRNDTYERRNHLIANASYEHMGDHVSVYTKGGIDWMRTSATTYQYVANFSSPTDEQSRGAVLDSLFAGGPDLRPSQELLDKLTSATYRSTDGCSQVYPDNLTLDLWMDVKWRPDIIRGLMRLSGSAKHSATDAVAGTLYGQPYAGDTSPSSLNREQWSDRHNRNTDASADLGYDWDKRYVGSKRVQTISLSPSAGWSLERQHRENVLEYQQLLESFDPKSSPLPSVTAPENIRPLIDAENTLNSLFLNNRLHARANAAYMSELLAPADSMFNPQLLVYATYGFTRHFRHLTYTKPYLTPQAFNYNLDRADNTHSLNLYTGISSSNNVEHTGFALSYSYNTSLVNLFTIMPTANTSDPFNIYLGPEEGESFRNPASHKVSLYYQLYRKKSGLNLYANASFSESRNSTAQTAQFNPATGVTIHRPVTVNGNRGGSLHTQLNTPLGNAKRWNINAMLNPWLTRNVDYVSSTGRPELSVVNSGGISGRLGGSFSLKNGTVFGLHVETTWHEATSPRADFERISATETNIGANIDFYLPWQIQGSTNLDAKIRRGYSDSVLNTTEWIWNASIQKSVLKGALTVKLVAVDILGQLSNIRYTVNGQGRTEMWTNSLPRYAMMTVSYRFSFTPKALQ